MSPCCQPSPATDCHSPRWGLWAVRRWSIGLGVRPRPAKVVGSPDLQKPRGRLRWVLGPVSSEDFEYPLPSPRPLITGRASRHPPLRWVPIYPVRRHPRSIGGEHPTAPIGAVVGEGEGKFSTSITVCGAVAPLGWCSPGPLHLLSVEAAVGVLCQGVAALLEAGPTHPIPPVRQGRVPLPLATIERMRWFDQPQRGETPARTTDRRPALGRTLALRPSLVRRGDYSDPPD